MSQCEDDAKGPQFVLDPAIGTTPCDRDASTIPTVCDPDACCNYYEPLKEGQGQAFILSEGGPFALPASGTASCPCPIQIAPVPLPVTPGAFEDPGSLASEICIDGLAPGSYRADVRFDLDGATPGSRVVVLFRPDCADASVEYSIVDFWTPCAPAQVSDCTFPLCIPLTNNSVDGFLMVPVTTCKPGFRVLVHTGCPIDGVSVRPVLKNFQFMLERKTARDIVNCGGVALKIASPAADVPAPCCV